MRVNVMKLYELLKEFDDKQLEELDIVIETDREKDYIFGRSEYVTEVEVYPSHIRLIHRKE